MILLFDIGNTRMKVSVSDHRGIFSVSDWEELLPRAEAVLVSNVAGPEALPLVVLHHPNCHVLSWQSPEVEQWLDGVHRGMGADRLAADIGARSMYPESTLLVIDAGTCVTFDVIDASGKILGGAISPGVSLRLKAMHEHTAALPLPDLCGEHPVMACDTVSAMRSGAVNGLMWEIEGYIRHTLSLFPDLHVCFTGGDSIYFPDDLSHVISRDPLLVQKGLLAAFI